MRTTQILVDQDGVLANWGKAWDEHLEPHGDGGMFIPRHTNQRSFDLKAGRTKDEIEIINAVMEAPNFYADLEPIPGAIEALKEMVAEGYDVAIVTSPYWSNPTCIADKVEWVRRNFGQSWVQRMILASDKTRVSGHILIDDKPEITGARVPNWEHVLFDQPYNREVTGKRRLLDWSGWREIVERRRRGPVQGPLLAGGFVPGAGGVLNEINPGYVIQKGPTGIGDDRLLRMLTGRDSIVPAGSKAFA